MCRGLELTKKTIAIRRWLGKFSQNKTFFTKIIDEEMKKIQYRFLDYLVVYDRIMCKTFLPAQSAL